MKLIKSQLKQRFIETNIHISASIIRVEKGDVLQVVTKTTNEYVEIQAPGFMIVKDLMMVNSSKAVVTALMQYVITDSETLHQNISKENKFIRMLCAKRGAIKLTLPYGICPITKEDEVIVAGSNCNEWYIIPMRDFISLRGELEEE